MKGVVPYILGFMTPSIYLGQLNYYQEWLSLLYLYPHSPANKDLPFQKVVFHFELSARPYSSTVLKIPA
ncbi:hypothetical protein DVH24_042697 [Malus domestica]|uniref:Uncharacterized protein n=1 Tax=Malus domestica TaxID=3750 RepID=A0A498HYK4_MALDO|nr:hypothetical protein DVH24_042697 [Malus domestica]